MRSLMYTELQSDPEACKAVSSLILRYAVLSMQDRRTSTFKVGPTRLLPEAKVYNMLDQNMIAYEVSDGKMLVNSVSYYANTPTGLTIALKVVSQHMQNIFADANNNKLMDVTIPCNDTSYTSDNVSKLTRAAKHTIRVYNTLFKKETK